MKINLSYSEFWGLYGLFNNYIVPFKDVQQVEDVLIHVCLLPLFKKLYNKALERKKTYPLKFEAHEAVAFWLFWQMCPLPPEMAFETNLLLKINNLIHPKYIQQ